MSKSVRAGMWMAGVALVLILFFPLVTRARLENMVKERINREVRAEVGWNRLKTGWLRGFPRISIRFFGLHVLGTGPFEGDTLARMELAELRISPFEVFGNEPELHAVILEHPSVRGRVEKNGIVNWDIFGEGKDDAGTHRERGSPGIKADQNPGDHIPEYTVKQVVISDGSLTYLDEAASRVLLVERFDLELRSGGAGDQKGIQLSMGLHGLNLTRSGVRYLRNSNCTLELIAEAGQENRQFIIRENRATLNGMAIETEGSFTLPDQMGTDIDLRFRSTGPSIGSLLSLMPSTVVNSMDSVRTEGEFRAEGWISGTWRDTLFPDASLSLEVTDGYVAFPDQHEAVSEIQLKLGALYNGRDLDSCWLDLERLHFLFADEAMEVAFQLSHPVSDPVMKGLARGSMDLGALSALAPRDQQVLSGRLVTDLQWDMSLSSLTEEQFDQVQMNGTLSLTDYEMGLSDLADRVMVRRLDLEVDPAETRLKALDAEIGPSDLHASGRVKQLVPYLFGRQILEGSLSVRSDLLDFQALIPPDTTNRDSTLTASRSFPYIARPDSLAEPIRFRIPERMNLDLSIRADRVRLPRLNASRMRAGLAFMEGRAVIRNLSMELLEGRVTMTGTAEPGGEFMEVEAAVKAENVDIPAAYRSLVSVKQLAPMAGYCRGEADINMQYRSMVDNEFTPIYETMSVTGRVQTRDLEIQGVNFEQVSQMVTNEKMQRMAPGEVDIGFYIREGRIGIDPFTLDFDESSVTVSGSHGIDHSLDYLVDMQIAKKDLGETARTMVNGLSFLAAATGKKVVQSDHVNVKAEIKGTFEQPRVKTDLSGNMVPKNSTGPAQ